MIPLNQLRIGNYFKWSDSTLIGTGRGIVNIYNMGFYRFMDPIPILGNEQWLLDRGFVKEGDYYNIRGENQLRYSIKYINDAAKWRIYIKKDDIREPDDTARYLISWYIEYIHQIQNLIFDLTHEELKLK